MGVGLGILTMLASLAVGASAVFVLALRTGSGVLWQLAGLFAAGVGIVVFLWAHEVLPFSLTQFREPLAFGTAYLGQTLMLLFLAFRVNKLGQLGQGGATE